MVESTEIQILRSNTNPMDDPNSAAKQDQNKNPTTSKTPKNTQNKTDRPNDTKIEIR